MARYNLKWDGLCMPIGPDVGYQDSPVYGGQIEVGLKPQLVTLHSLMSYCFAGLLVASAKRCCGGLALISLITIMAVSCSKGGRGSDPDDKLKDPFGPNRGGGDNPTDTEIKKRKKTLVGFETFDQYSSLSKDCVTPLEAADLAIPPDRTPTLDGDLSDWLDLGRKYKDPLNDQKGSLSLDSFQVGVSRDDLWIAVPIESPNWQKPSSRLFLEFYRGYRINSTIQLVWERVIVVADDQFALYDLGNWIDIPSPFAGEVRKSNQGAEIRLSRRQFLGEITESPVWGMMISLDSGPDSGWSDYSSLVVNPGLTGKGFDQLTHGGCHPDEYSKLGLTYQTVQGGGPEPSIGLIRSVEDPLSEYVSSDEYPVSSVPIFVAPNPLNLVRPQRNLGAGTLGEFIEFPGFRSFGGSRFGINDSEGFEYVDLYQYRAIEQTIFGHLNIYLFGSYKHSSKDLRSVVAYAVASHIIRERFGRRYWLEMISRDMSITHRLGILLEQLVNDNDKVNGAKRLLDAWKIAVDRENQLEEEAAEVDELFWIAAIDQMPELVEPLNSLRYALDPTSQGSYLDWIFRQFSDDDGDGLPMFFEQRIGVATDPLVADSDGDGWSDYSELLAGVDSSHSASHPEYLVNDGIFGDFTDLVPDKIEPDDGAECTGTGDINSYAVVLDGDQMFAALKHAGIESDRDIGYRWLLDIDMPSLGYTAELVVDRGQHDIQIKGADGQLQLQLRTAVPVGRYAVEIAVTTAQLGFKLFSEDIRFKWSVYRTDDGAFCDDTLWFEPVWRGEIPVSKKP